MIVFNLSKINYKIYIMNKKILSLLVLKMMKGQNFKNRYKNFVRLINLNFSQLLLFYIRE